MCGQNAAVGLAREAFCVSSNYIVILCVMLPGLAFIKAVNHQYFK